MIDYNFFIKNAQSRIFYHYWINFLNEHNEFLGFYCFNYPFGKLDKLSKLDEEDISVNITYAYQFSFNFKELSIYFFKHEPTFTKLKYSRVPQFDASATTVASFLSALIGYLICEKTGFELLDSGDLVFTCVYCGLYVITGSLFAVYINEQFRFKSCIENYFASFI